MEIFDVSRPIYPGMPRYPGDCEVLLERICSLEKGDAYNLTRIQMGVHAGTHVDAPSHFIQDAYDVDSLALDALIGPAFVVDATGVESDIDAAALARMAPPSESTRLLFKTRNSELREKEEFSPDFIAFTEDAARALVDRGVRLLGIDYLSAAPASDPVSPHLVLLNAGVVVLEGLDLRKIEPGPYWLACLPLRLVDCEGAPARTVLIRGMPTSG